MDYKASVTLITKPGSLKGVASVSINEEFVVKGLKIYEGEKGAFVSMPSRKVGEEYEDICFPLTKEGREALHNAVLNEYEQKLSQQEEQINEEGGKGKKSGGGKKSQKQSDEHKADENAEGMSENQEEQTEAGPEMSM